MLGAYLKTGFVTAIDEAEYHLHDGSAIAIADAPAPIWTPPKHMIADLSRYLPLLGQPRAAQITTIAESWEHCGNLAELAKPTYTEKHGQWTIGACFKDSKLVQIQITETAGTWYRQLEATKATKKDCFSLGRSAIDYIASVLSHLPDPAKFAAPEPIAQIEAFPDSQPAAPDLSWELSQDSEIASEFVPFELLDRSVGTQQRQSLNPQQLEEYESRYKRGEEAPPAEVYKDLETGKLILKHGFHRDVAKQRALSAVRKAIEIRDLLPTYGDGNPTVKAGFEKELYDLDLQDVSVDRLQELADWLGQGLWCQIKIDSESNAVWDSCSDNADNGATRTRADLYRAIDTALRHPKAKTLNAGEVAAHVKTSIKTIRKRRGQLEAAGAIAPQTAVTAQRGGKSYTMSLKGLKRPDTGRQTAGHTFADLQALYAPFGEFKRYWDAVKKFEFIWPEGKCHFKDLDEAAEKFAKVTDGLIKIVDRPQPAADPAVGDPDVAPELKIGDYVRGYDYTDGRREVRGAIASLNDKTILLNTGKRIFASGAILSAPRYAKTDDRGQEKEAVKVDPDKLEFTRNDYGLVVIDPPWEYALRETDQSHRGRTPYPTMSDHEILNLPIAHITAADSYCLLWATANHLPLAFKCLESWGFEYKAIHTWAKTTLSGEGLKIGLGHYGRNCAEFFLVGVKGSPGSFSTLGLTDIPSVILDAPTAHSVKPEKFYRLAHRLSNALGAATIELFARSEQPGWDLWGAEAPIKIQSPEVKDGE
jgi:N6-adenosine-specific RNA methylase IME4